MALLAHHQKLIDASAISREVAEARGYRSVTVKAELQALGFAPAQRRTPALLAPVFDYRGEVVTYHLRPDEPRILKERALKYETPAGSRMAVDVPPPIRHQLRDPTVPLLITEGVRKADSAVSTGMCCVALMGTWCWRGTNDVGGKALLADFDAIAFNGRTVYVVFDSDVMVKPSVHAAVDRLVPVLRNRDANVAIIYLPDGPDGQKVGLDDYLAAGHSTEQLLALAERSLRPLQGATTGDVRYTADGDGLIWNQRARGGVSPVRIANFSGRIVVDRELHDGAETSRWFELEVELRGTAKRVLVSTAEFRDGSWVLERLGGEAIVEAVPRVQDHLAAGIQHVSGEIEQRVAYAHTGWAEINGVWVYITASGGIGGEGHLDVEVELPEGLRGYALADPPAGGDLVDAVRASLELLSLGPDAVMFPILATAYRAPLGSLDFVLFLVGQTGSLKTAVAAVAQQHYGPELDANHLPLSWTDTANALEAQLFVLKDVVAVVDDFAPGGTRTDVQRAHRDADRVFRSAANGQGRRRMRADTTIRPVKPPRALILGTGEELPRGHSIRARMHAIPIEPTAIDSERLTEVQRNADSGLLSEAMAGYVAWLSRQRSEIISRQRGQLAELRERARGVTAHRRPVETAASLGLGLRYLLQFAEATGAIDASERSSLWERGWDAIMTSTAGQERLHQDAEPVARSIVLLASALATGTAHIANLHGEAPNDAGAWGWRDGGFEAAPMGRRVGWTDGSNLYLDRDATHAVVQKLAAESGEALPVSAATLAKRMHEKNLLASTEQDARGTLTVRRPLDGTRRAVLHLDATALHPSPDPTAGRPKPTSPTTHPTNALSHPDGAEDARGQVGQSGQHKEETSRDAADADQLSLSTTPPPTTEADQPDQRAPCPYPHHRSSDWRSSKSGLRVCGICHPPATPDVVAHEIETPSAPF